MVSKEINVKELKQASTAYTVLWYIAKVDQ